MKKNNSLGNNLTEKVPIKHFLLIMRTTFILLFICVFCSMAEMSYTQNARVTINKRNVTLKEILNEIESQTDYLFIYSNEVNTNEKVSVSAKQQAVSNVLNLLLRNKDVNYSMEGNHIILSVIEKAGNQEEVVATFAQQQKKTIIGTVVDASGLPVIGANIVEVGTTNGTVTDVDGKFSLSVDNNVTIRISYIGYLEQDINSLGITSFNIVLQEDTKALDELIVVGYGAQKRSDITGSVTSLSKERLDMPYTDVLQAMQGSLPGVSITTTSSGAVPGQSLMIRGRNSIRASNDPLVIVDGVPGSINDVQPNDIQSIEVLKDASAAAIYGSRGSNGVILITSKKGASGAANVSYDGYLSLQNHINYPHYLTGPEFYEFKNIREPGQITLSEQQVYDSGKWVDWYKEATRQGISNQHNVSVSGGLGTTKYYISGNFLNTKGIALGDNYLRITGRVNLETKVADWLTIGTNTSYSYRDSSGESTNYNYPEALLSRMNPLTTAYDENGNLTIYPWPEDRDLGNPLQPTLYDDTDLSNLLVSNNFTQIDFPFIEGMSYRLNTGVRNRFNDKSTYKGRDTRAGLVAGGSSYTNKSKEEVVTVENIINYNKEIEKHNIFITGLYSYEHFKITSNEVNASGFPNDFLKIYAVSQANLATPSYGFSASTLISQMLRLNYSFDSRYLITLTGRRDGFSGFGKNSKWGVFPSIALGWNVLNEKFFPYKDFFSELKTRISYGLNGNQAVGSFETISRLQIQNHISDGVTQAGYRPSKLGSDDLGWETSKTLNVGLDFGILNNRIRGDINYFNTITNDLLLNRSISPVHGILSITQNIGKTSNKGIELSINSNNIVNKNFQWSTIANFSYIKNQIVSLYGTSNEDGNEIDDVANKWFIGEPIRVIYDFIWDGVWQLDEAEEAAIYESKPGYVKLRDINKDGKLNAADRKILGQYDPKYLLGLTNTFTYKNLSLSVFLHGVFGTMKQNLLLNDRESWENVRLNVTKKNWWTPDNPTNDWIVNDIIAHRMGGINWEEAYEKSDFIRVKDITLYYDLPNHFIQSFGLNRLRLFANGRNLFTFTQFNGIDPELDEDLQFPLQRELIFGLNLSF